MTMLDNESYKAAFQWFKRAERKDDPFSKFDDLFKSFNRIYSLNNEIDDEKGQVSRFCFENIDILKKFNAFDSDIIQIIYNKPVINLKNNRPCLVLQKKIIRRDIISLFELFYIVRCNLFHGCKMPDDPRDNKLTEACALLLEGYLKVYFENVEYESETKINNIN